MTAVQSRKHVFYSTQNPRKWRVAKCRVNKYAHKYVNSVALDTRTENGNENNYLLIAASSSE